MLIAEATVKKLAALLRKDMRTPGNSVSSVVNSQHRTFAAMSLPNKTLWLPFRNTTGDDIPAHAVLQPKSLIDRTQNGTKERWILEVEKPNDSPTPFYLINGGRKVRYRETGFCTMPIGQPTEVLIDPDADPEFLDAFGPVENEWYLGPSNAGFLWLGLTDDSSDDPTAQFIQGIPPDGVLFRNDASETMPAYGVGRITGDTDVSGNSVTKVTKPDTTWSRNWLTNGTKDVAAGKYGIGYLMDGKKRRVLYDSGTPAFGEGWGPKPSQWSLSKGYYGFDIFGNNDTDALTTYAKAKPIETLFGKLAGGTLAQGGTQTANIWAGDGGSEAATSFTAITVRDWFMKSGATAIANGKKVKIEWRLNAYYATLAECA